MTFKQALDRIGKMLVSTMRSKVPVNSGKLKRSLDYSVTEDKSGLGLTTEMESYGQFVDSGVKGTSNKKGFESPQSLYDIGKFKSKTIAPQSGLPYPVRLTIARDGLKPQPFIIPSYDQVMKDKGEKILTDAGVDIVTADIDKVLKSQKLN
jgi:hypothetical protein